MIPNPNAVAAKWTTSSDITLRETYTNNSSLSASREGDFITQITPGIRLAGSGARFKANLRYAPSVLFHARNSREDRITNTLTAAGNVEAIENFFFVDVNGNISQSFISPFQAQPAETSTSTPNRVETRTYGISPYVRGQVRGAFSYELRNRNTWTHADTRELADVQTAQWTGRIASPIRLFGWALEYDDTRISDNLRPERHSRLYRARLYFQADRTLRLSTSAGREENNYGLLQETRYYDIYGAGLSWKPGARTSADLEWEQRFFGPSHLARLEHRTRLTAWRFSYSRNASNFQQELLTLPPGNTAAILDAIFAARIPDPLERQAAVEQFLQATGTPAFLANPLSFYTQQIFLRERLEGSVGIVGKRNSVTLTVFHSEATALLVGFGPIAQDAFLFGDRITQRGFGLRANHKLTPFTTLGAGATRTYARQEEPATRESRNDHLSLNLTHRLSQKTNMFAGLSFSHFSAGDVASDRRDATSVFVGMHHQF